MHHISSEYNALGAAIDALKTPRFTAALVGSLRHALDFDCAVILGHRPGKHPIYLYDSLQSQRDLLFKNYLTDAYREDPFYQLINNGTEGVLSYADVSEYSTDSQDYREQFYRETRWQDELCMAVKITDDRWVVFYLGLLQTGSCFSSAQVEALRERFHLLAALCRQHWAGHPFHLAEPGTGNDGVGHVIHLAVSQFGAGLLSTREQQITSLLVQGLDSREIAESLGIAEGTVKNHRKRIYAQLHVNSLSELFRLFLNDLIAAPRSS